MLTLTVISILALAIAIKAYAYPPRPRWLTPMEWAVGMCESQLNWQHNSGTYQGAFGFYYGSWDQFKPAGYPADAYQATPWQQTVVMRRIRARYGWSGWGCVTHGGYRYWIGRTP